MVYYPSKSYSPPLGPPALRRKGSPYACIPLPPVHDHGDRCHAALISIHVALRLSPKSSVQFDFGRSLSTITLLPDHRQLSSDILTAPATEPPLPCLNMISPLLPWSITVLPSSPYSWNQSVTVSDVLDSLHRALDLTVTDDEFDELASDDVRTIVKAAYERRVRSHHDWRVQESERRLGVKRIDLLMGRTRFQGLSIKGRQRDIIVHIC